MRERWARGLALMTGLLVVLLSVAFAAVQNPAPATPAAEAGKAVAAPPDAARLARGRAALETQGCLRCHAVAGRGSPRSPLDGVGARRTAAEIRRWVVADPAVHEELAPRVIAVKEGYAALPEDELDAIVAYLASLTVTE